jgi:hypothetical protein
MTDNNNGWPDPARPGVPLNPEWDGWHWVQEPGQDQECALWRAKPFLGADRGSWETKGTEDDWQPYEISNWHYLGPVLTPAEVDARVKEARRDALEEEAQRAAHYERMAYQHGHLPVDDPHECAAQVAREIETSIRALKGEAND